MRTSMPSPAVTDWPTRRSVKYCFDQGVQPFVFQWLMRLREVERESGGAGQLSEQPAQGVTTIAIWHLVFTH